MQQADAALDQLSPRRLNLDPATIRNFSQAELASLIGVHWPTADEAQHRQLQRELAAWTQGYDRLMATWQKAQADGNPLRHDPVQRLAQHYVLPLAEAIERLAEDAQRRRGPKPAWLTKAYSELGAARMAFIALSAIIFGALEHNAKKGRHEDKALTSTHLRDHIGHELAHATRLATWKRLCPDLFHAFEQRLDDAGASDRHRKTVMALGLGKLDRYSEGDDTSAELIAATEPWTHEEEAQIGMWLLLEAEKTCPGLLTTGKVTTKKGKSGYATTYSVELSDDTLEWATEAMHRKALHSTLDRPMLCEPLPWRGPQGGGYLLGIRRHLVSDFGQPSSAAQVDAFRDNPPEEVLSAINAVQSVAWEINPAVLAVAQEADARGLRLSGLPDGMLLPIPPKPRDIDTNEEARERWKREAAPIKGANARKTMKAAATRTMLSEAAELGNEEAFWFAAFADTRGHIYSRGRGLNPQGNDLSRSLLRFARGKAIGATEGPRALAAQVAKAFGHDKLAWEDRIAWTEANVAMLRRIATDPLGNRQEWVSAAGDGIWSALAAASEWCAFLDSDRDPRFITKLACYIDGTCNGLQHFAALVRDQELARKVNLEPGTSKADVYQAVADRLLRLVHEARDHGSPDDRRAADLWLRIIDTKCPSLRPLVKPAVMVKPYGGTVSGIRDEVRDFWEEVDGEDDWLDVLRQDEREVPKLHRWLASKIDGAIGNETAAADKIMRWLKTAAQLMNKHKAKVDPPWRTPSGWPWSNTYLASIEKRHVLKKDGQRREHTTYRQNPDKPDTTRQLNGISPNFIQGLDAAALMLAVSNVPHGGRSNEAFALTTIHDCVGGLAPDMPIIAEAVREGFVEVHEANPLASYREAVLKALPDDKARAKLPPLPKVRAFDLKRVLKSPFFFC